MKKKKFLKTATAMLLFNGALFNISAQVTIGSDQAPKTTLDVVTQPDGSSTADGITAPRLTLAQLNARSGKYGTAQTGAMVYITDASGSTKPGYSDQVTCVGLVFWSGGNWLSSCAQPKTYAVITAQPKAFTFYETGFETPEALVFGAGGSSTMTYKWYKISGNNINARVAVPCVGTDVVGGAANLNKNTFKPNVIKGTTENANNTGFYRYYCVAKNATNDSVVSHIAEVAVGCGAKNLSGEWISFMCHNLGADNQTIATQKSTSIQLIDNGAVALNTFLRSANERKLYGDLYQWGRIADGHENRNAILEGSTGGLITTDNCANWNTTPDYETWVIPGTSPGVQMPVNQVARNSVYYGKFIKTVAPDFNWFIGTASDADILWRETLNNTNDPCRKVQNDGTVPSGNVDAWYPPTAASPQSNNGWRMPSQSEWAMIYRGGSTSGTPAIAMANTWVWYNNGNSAVTNGVKGFEVKPDGVTTTLFLPASGQRYRSNALLYYSGINGYYWTGTTSGNNSVNVTIGSNNINPSGIANRGNGFAVRCIKN